MALGTDESYLRDDSDVSLPGPCSDLDFRLPCWIFGRGMRRTRADDEGGCAYLTCVAASCGHEEGVPGKRCTCGAEEFGDADCESWARVGSGLACSSVKTASSCSVPAILVGDVRFLFVRRAAGLVADGCADAKEGVGTAMRCSAGERQDEWGASANENVGRTWLERPGPGLLLCNPPGLCPRHGPRSLLLFVRAPLHQPLVHRCLHTRNRTDRRVLGRGGRDWNEFFFPILVSDRHALARLAPRLPSRCRTDTRRGKGRQ